MGDQTLLGNQRAAVDEAVAKLATDRPAGVLLRGPSGSGKTFLARHMGALACAASDSLLVEATGQRAALSTPLVPWRLSSCGDPAGGLRRDRLAEVTAETLKASSKLTLGVGELVAVLLNARRRLHRGPATLSDDQYAVLHRLARTVRDRPWAVIADDLQWWDVASTELLRALLLEPFREAFPFLKRMRLITVLNDGAVPLAEHVQRFLNDFRPAGVGLSQPGRDDIAEALRRSGLSAPTPDVVELVQAATGGHLHLVSEVGLYLAGLGGNAGATGAAWLTGGGGGTDPGSFLRDIFESRLDRAAAGDAAVVGTLEAAAAIGVMFSEEELRCLTASQEPELAQRLLLAAQLAVLDREGRVIRFRHAVLQQLLQPRSPSRSAELHRQFTACLKRLNPGDYESRAHHHRLAGDDEAADVMVVLAAARRLREGGSGEHLADAATALSARASRLAEPCRRLLEATRLALSQDYAAAVAVIDGCPADAPALVRAEAAYLVSDCRLKSLDAGGRRLAKDVIERWRGRVADEFELWLRLSLTLVAAHALNGENAAAHDVEGAVARAIDARQHFDPACDDYRVELYRRSDAVHDPEISQRRLADAVAALSGADAGRPPRRPVAYARAVSNLVGIHAVLGDYDAAIDAARQLARCVASVPQTILPRPATAGNNVLVAQALREPVDHASVLAGFRSILATCTRPEERVLVRSNYATCLVRAGQLAPADSEFAECRRELDETYEPDAYYRYFIDSNSLGLDVVLGRVPDPAVRWDRMRHLLRDLPGHMKVFLERRHDLYREALGSAAPWTADGWDGYVRRRFPRELGRAWSFYGRGFLLSDIQHWSDG